MVELRGRVALVTGGARRLGRAIAEALAEAGMSVAVHCRGSRSEADAVVRGIEARGVRAVAIEGDLARTGAAKALVEGARAALGRLDVLVNNASVFRPTPLDRVTEADWDEHLDVNLKAPFFCALEAARVIRESAGEGGSIVNLVDASVETPWPRFVPYQVSKAGLHALTGYLARAFAPQVRVNGVSPGAVLLPEGTAAAEADIERAVAAVPLARWGRPEDVAEAVVYLARAQYVTGVVLPVDGGRRLG